MRMTTRRRTAALVAAGLLALAGCSGDDPGGTSDDGAAASTLGGERTTDGVEGAATGLTETQRAHLVEDGSTTWDVTYSDDTVVVDGPALDGLTAADDDAGTYTFDRDALATAGLELAEGDVLLLAGRALRRVTGVTDAGGAVTVQSEPATLADAVQDGTVAWDVPLAFSFDQFLAAVDDDAQALGAPGEVRAASTGQARLARIGMRMPDGQVVPVQSGEDVGKAIHDSIEVDREAGSVAWTYEAQGNTFRFRLTSHGDSVDILVVVSRGAAGDSTMAFRGEGTITSMRSTATTSYADGELTSSDIDVQELGGTLDLTLAVAGAGVSPVELEVPVPMLTYTWLVGPVPVTVDLTAQVIGNVDASANASAQAKASFAYRGDVGLTYEGTEVAASGATDIDEMDPEPADSAAAMGLDVDAQFGVAFPTVSLSIFGQGIVPSLHWGAVIGSSLHWGGPAAGFPASSVCKEAYVRMEVNGGYDITVLGQDLASETFDPPLYTDERRTTGDSCPDEE